jgi:hypothetical protein
MDPHRSARRYSLRISDILEPLDSGDPDVTLSVWLKAFVLWLVILPVAVGNGILREIVLIPALGRPVGLAASGIALSLLIFIIAWLAAPWYGAMHARRYWHIGALWLGLTLAFEFGFGRLVQHKTWDQLLQAYNFSGGNIWPAVLAMTFFSPRLAAWVRDKA